jgi:hypothetical protein
MDARYYIYGFIRLSVEIMGYMVHVLYMLFAVGFNTEVISATLTFNVVFLRQKFRNISQKFQNLFNF